MNSIMRNVFLCIILCLLISYCANSKNVVNDNNINTGGFKSIKQIRNYMKSLGYSETRLPPSFYEKSIYLMVYMENMPNNNTKIVSYFRNDRNMLFVLTYYSNKPNDPNLYSRVFFKVNGKDYYFLKINYMLEITKESTYIDGETGEKYIQKEFY